MLVLALPRMHIQVETAQQLLAAVDLVAFDAGMPDLGRYGTISQPEHAPGEGEQTIAHLIVGKVLPGLLRVEAILLPLHQLRQVALLPIAHNYGSRIGQFQACQ